MLVHGARTRIVVWVLALVLGALTLATGATWRLLVADTDARIDVSLNTEVEEFIGLTAPGRNPSGGVPFTSLDQALRSAIADNLARPNEKFLAYLDGAFRYQSRLPAPAALDTDEAFRALVVQTTQPHIRTYASSAGPVRYVGVPITFAGHPGRGVVVAAYFVNQERAAANKASRFMAAAGAVTALLAAMAAWAVAGRILRPVREVAVTASSITETDLSARIPASPSSGVDDEIGQVVQAVNAMLDRVEAGVGAQRRFVDDASHELRTPITIIRGHLDVVDLDDRADVESTLELVDDELSRMNRIVSELLVLAKADQPEFVRLELTDLRSLMIETLAKAERLAQRHWALSLPAQLDPDGSDRPLEGFVDAQRVTQALLVLADNAARHTESRDTINLGARTVSSANGTWLRLWVSDTGVGVPPADRARVFERFARGSASRRSEGAGLGLAIASAIASAHGGRVEVTDGVGAGPPTHSGPGVTFALVLPKYGPRKGPASSAPANVGRTESPDNGHRDTRPGAHGQSRNDEQHSDR